MDGPSPSWSASPSTRSRASTAPRRRTRPRVAAVGGRVGERPDDVQHLDDRAGPAVGDDHGQGVRVRRPDVDEVDVEAVDLGQVLRDGVQPRRDPAEVVVVAQYRTSACIVASGTPWVGRRRSPSRASASPGAGGGARRCPPGRPRRGTGGWPPRHPGRVRGCARERHVASSRFAGAAVVLSDPVTDRRGVAR